MKKEVEREICGMESITSRSITSRSITSRSMVSRPGRHGRVLGASTLAAAWLAFASGCTTPPQGLTFKRGVEHDDFPVPARFELRESRALGQDLVEPFRSWEAVYRGKGAVLDLAPWYLQAMQEHQWRLSGVKGTRTDKTLTFEKGDEVAKVRLYRQMSQGEYATMIHGEIHPRGPESLTVDEHLKNFEQHRAGAGVVEPASFKEAPGAAPAPAAAGAQPRTRASATGATAPMTTDRDLDQISEAEHEYE